MVLTSSRGDPSAFLVSARIGTEDGGRTYPIGLFDTRDYAADFIATKPLPETRSYLGWASLRAIEYVITEFEDGRPVSVLAKIPC